MVFLFLNGKKFWAMSKIIRIIMKYKEISYKKINNNVVDIEIPNIQFP